MTKSNRGDYYSSTSIKKDLLERSRARAERRNKPIYKVSGKSAKVLEKAVVPVTIKSGGAGYTTCCGKADCAFCGEIPLKSYASLPYVGYWSEEPKSYFTKLRELHSWALDRRTRPVSGYRTQRGIWSVLELQAEKRVAKARLAVHKNQVKINNK
jgi:hypothetical protein